MLTINVSRNVCEKCWDQCEIGDFFLLCAVLVMFEMLSRLRLDWDSLAEEK